jgi:mono/diheme cytochrome c family protein
MRFVPIDRPAVRYALGAAACAFMVATAFSVSGGAQQMRPVSEGVYSAAQATRGQTLYTAECESCHGADMAGTIGPPLVGDFFLSHYSEAPLAVLVDKIAQTMPFNTPGSLSREQAIDLTAYMLQYGEFPAGQAALVDSALAQIGLPATQMAAAPTGGGGAGSLPPPEGNLAELMRGVHFPNSNIIFNLQLKNPSEQPRIEVEMPFDYTQWGTTIYPGWLAVDQAAIALTETAALLLTPGRLCQNGKRAPVEQADWIQAVADLVEVSKEAHQASRVRNFDAFIDISEKLNESCDSCHRVYRDTGGTEGGIGGDRCVTPAP